METLRDYWPLIALGITLVAGLLWGERRITRLETLREKNEEHKGKRK